MVCGVDKDERERVTKLIYFYLFGPACFTPREASLLPVLPKSLELICQCKEWPQLSAGMVVEFQETCFHFFKKDSRILVIPQQIVVTADLSCKALVGFKFQSVSCLLLCY